MSSRSKLILQKALQISDSATNYEFCNKDNLKKSDQFENTSKSHTNNDLKLTDRIQRELEGMYFNNKIVNMIFFDTLPFPYIRLAKFCRFRCFLNSVFIFRVYRWF